MKKLTTPLLAALLALSTSSRLPAADPESAFGLAPSAAPQLQPASPSSSLPLIPDAPRPEEKPASGDGRSPSDKTEIAEDKLKKKIALRQARTKAEREPDLQALLASAHLAKTDFEQRKIYIDYYTALVGRIAKYNPGMKKEEIEALKAQCTGRFYQNHIAPTIDPAIARAQP